MAAVTILGSSSSRPIPRVITNQNNAYDEIGHYWKKFPIHQDPICQEALHYPQYRRTRATTTLASQSKTLLFNAGPDIGYQLKRYQIKPDAVLLNHDHQDAIGGTKNLNSQIPMFSESKGNLIPNKMIKLFHYLILPFRVKHSREIKTVGLQVKLGGKKIIYLTDIASLIGTRQYLFQADLILADGSILERNLPWHLSMKHQLVWYKRWQVKKVIFTHIGHDTLPFNELRRYVKKRYSQADIAYDGLKINL